MIYQTEDSQGQRLWPTDSLSPKPWPLSLLQFLKNLLCPYLLPWSNQTVSVWPAPHKSWPDLEISLICSSVPLGDRNAPGCMSSSGKCDGISLTYWALQEGEFQCTSSLILLIINWVFTFNNDCASLTYSLCGEMLLLVASISCRVISQFWLLLGILVSFSCGGVKSVWYFTLPIILWIESTVHLVSCGA